MYYDIALDLQIGFNIWDRLKHVFFNSGGPRSRTRRETIRSTILGDLSVGISWPQKMTVGLTFPDEVDPVEILNDILEKKGLADPDDVKEIYSRPSTILYCKTIKESDEEGKEIFPDVLTIDANVILKTALILCLCNKHFYDPDRSLIWTSNRLKRKVCLYQVGDFYAAD